MKKLLLFTTISLMAMDHTEPVKKTAPALQVVIQGFKALQPELKALLDDGENYDFVPEFDEDGYCIKGQTNQCRSILLEVIYPQFAKLTDAQQKEFAPTLKSACFGLNLLERNKDLEMVANELSQPKKEAQVGSTKTVETSATPDSVLTEIQETLGKLRKTTITKRVVAVELDKATDHMLRQAQKRQPQPGAAACVTDTTDWE